MKSNSIYEKMKEIDVELSEHQCNQFLTYYDMLVERNKVMNLTTITEFDEVVLKHFVDSISLVKVIDLHKISSLIDIGTGAGFPGIPLKIYRPELQVVLLDSLNKRIKFLTDVINTLELQSVKVLHGRAEDFSRDNEYREKFDLCVSRAVANLSTLSEYCLPYVKIGGSFISYKADKATEEAQQAKNGIFLLGGKIISQTEFYLPGSNMIRNLIKIEKVSKTSSRYPRKAGIPSKEPL